jgi:hypothetical protein
MTERGVFAASPTDPRVEYIPFRQARRRTCSCPDVEVWFGDDRVTADGLIVPTRHQVKVLHSPGCAERVTVAVAPTSARDRLGWDFGLSGYLAGLPRAIRCLECGDVRYSAGPEPGQRKCWRCDHVWRPS